MIGVVLWTWLARRRYRRGYGRGTSPVVVLFGTSFLVGLSLSAFLHHYWGAGTFGMFVLVWWLVR